MNSGQGYGDTGGRFAGAGGPGVSNVVGATIGSVAGGTISGGVGVSSRAGGVGVSNGGTITTILTSPCGLSQA